MTRILTLLITCLLLVGCTSSSIAPASTSTSAPTALPTNTPTPTPEPTPTPTPIDGLLFFDMNGSGLKDEASFQYDAARLTDERQPLQADLLAAINAYLSEHPDIKDGDLVTLEEPGLSGYTVCAGSKCVTTDDLGRFQLVEPEVSRSVNVTIQDPNAGTPALEMRYINKWKRAVTVAEYTRDVDAATMVQLKDVPDCSTEVAALVCKQDEDTLLVREQHLNDTAILELEDGIELIPGMINEIGLMQGFLTYPYLKSNFTIGIWFDHIFNSVNYKNYSGETNPYRNPANIYISGDNHDGTDFAVPYGTVVLAMAEGNVNYSDIILPNGSLHTTLEHINRNFLTGTGHHSVLLVNRDDKVFRGEIIALSGKSGTSWPHIHLNLHFSKPGVNPPPTTDPYGVLWDIENEYEKKSWWSSHNLPFFKDSQ